MYLENANNLKIHTGWNKVQAGYFLKIDKMQCRRKVQKSGGPALKEFDWLEGLVIPNYVESGKIWVGHGPPARYKLCSSWPDFKIEAFAWPSGWPVTKVLSL